MCGINGLLYRKVTPDIIPKLQLMNTLIVHRGPDDDGVYCDERVAMGMRRLSVIDLSNGNQPMQNRSGNIVIVFNGEIYNYQDLKNELLQQGVLFETESDTEVILKLYEAYGEAMLSKLNGMFAFSIHDKRNNQLFIARDRFGEKPLYYHHTEQEFIWASELKSIIAVHPELKVISRKALTLYLSLTYIPAPHTIYQDVFKLLPGHYIKIDTTTLQKKIHEYWDLNPATKADSGISYGDAQKQIRGLLFESVEKRMIADVPLGVFLSGGVDSTIIAAIMAKTTDQKVKTFSVGYENKRYDESARARQVANHIGAEHHEYILDYNDLFDVVDNIVLNYDEPYADSSCLPTYFISSKTVQQVTVALTGDGGDEVFGGYNKYMLPHYRKKVGKYVPGFLRPVLKSGLASNILGRGDSKSVLSKVKKVADLLNEDTVAGHFNLMALGFRQHELDKLLRSVTDRYTDLLTPYITKIAPAGDELKQLRYIDKQISLEGDMLVKVDRASMLCSLECRSPFLDHRIMEYTYHLPDEYLIKNGDKKRILKDTFADMLPDGFFNAPKSGFEIPVGDWLRGPLKADMLETLSDTILQQTGLFNIGYIKKLIADHLTARANNARQLWTLYCFQKWYNKNIN
ncbi:asparagine synthase (glutamine-hydrolyzing) [Mucilaginibacter sp. AW1-3]